MIFINRLRLNLQLKLCLKPLSNNTSEVTTMVKKCSKRLYEYATDHITVTIWKETRPRICHFRICFRFDDSVTSSGKVICWRCANHINMFALFPRSWCAYRDNARVCDTHERWFIWLISTLIGCAARINIVLELNEHREIKQKGYWWRW